MPSVTINAGVLGPPTADGTADEARRYVSALLDWGWLLDEPWVAVHMSARTAVALVDDDLYPIRSSLKNLFAANGVEEYDANTVATVAERLLNHTPTLEERFGISDVLADGLLVEPDILGSSAGSALQSDLTRCLIIIAILRRYCRDATGDHLLILRWAPQPAVTVQARIEVIEHNRDDLMQLPTTPDIFQGNVLICEDFRGFVECLDESSILVCSTDNAMLEISVRVALYKSRLNQGIDPDWDELRGLRIGHRFARTVQDACESRGDSFPARVLRAIVETLDRENMTATHALRTGSGADNPQRRRAADGAGAMRRDIDQDHHLHYWKCADGVVELASISYPHDDFSIPE